MGLFIVIVMTRLGVEAFLTAMSVNPVAAGPE